MFHIRKQLENVFPIKSKKGHLSLPDVSFQYVFLDRPLVTGTHITFECQPKMSYNVSVKLLLTNVCPQWPSTYSMNNTNMATIIQDHLHTLRTFKLELKNNVLEYTLDGDSTTFQKCMCIDITQPLYIAVNAWNVAVKLKTNIKDVKWLSTTYKEEEGGNFVVTDDDAAGMPDPEYSYYISNRGEYGGPKIYHELSGKIRSQFQLQAVDPTSDMKVTTASLSLFPFRNVSCQLLAAQACFLDSAFTTYKNNSSKSVTCVIEPKQGTTRGWVQLYITNANPKVAIRGPFSRDSSLIVELATVTITNNAVVTLGLEDVGLIVGVGQAQYSVSNIPYVDLQRPLYVGVRAGGVAVQIGGHFDHTNEVYHLGVENSAGLLASNDGVTKIQTELSNTAQIYSKGVQPLIEFSIKPVSASPRLNIQPVYYFGWLGSRACKPPSLREGGPPPPPIADASDRPIVKQIYPKAEVPRS